MSKRPQKKYTSQFKSAVALELIKGEETLSQICSKYEIHTTQAVKWKKRAIEGMKEIFENKSSSELLEKDKLIEDLYKQAGKKQYENDWLKKKLGI